MQIKFLAHNATSWQRISTLEPEAAYQIVCALNFTGFDFQVFNGVKDVTAEFEARINLERNTSLLPVTKTTGLDHSTLWAKS